MISRLPMCSTRSLGPAIRKARFFPPLPHRLPFTGNRKIFSFVQSRSIDHPHQARRALGVPTNCYPVSECSGAANLPILMHFESTQRSYLNWIRIRKRQG